MTTWFNWKEVYFFLYVTGVVFYHCATKFHSTFRNVSNSCCLSTFPYCYAFAVFFLLSIPVKVCCCLIFFWQFSQYSFHLGFLVMWTWAGMNMWARGTMMQCVIKSSPRRDGCRSPAASVQQDHWAEHLQSLGLFIPLGPSSALSLCVCLKWTIHL